jgi:GT2 family glycosyltransferase
MSSRPLLSFVVITHRRADQAREAVQSALKQDYPNKEVVLLVSPAGDTFRTLRTEFGDIDTVTVVQEESRRGVAAARNEAFEIASGDFFVILDDDAVFANNSIARRIVSLFNDNPDVGVIAFRSEDYDSGEVIPVEIPRGPNGKDPDNQYRTTYFVGVGAAFRRSALETTSGFPDDFFYYMEEIDLSFQLMKQGYELLYDPDIVVKHKGSGEGRPDENEHWQLTLENRIRVSIRHLPLRHFVISTVVWTLYVIYRTRLSLLPVLRAYHSILSDLNDLKRERQVLSEETQCRVAKLNGRLWN